MLNPLHPNPPACKKAENRSALIRTRSCEGSAPTTRTSEKQMASPPSNPIPVAHDKSHIHLGCSQK